jgi:hypothetical protein
MSINFTPWKLAPAWMQYQNWRAGQSALSKNILNGVFTNAIGAAMTSYSQGRAKVAAQAALKRVLATQASQTAQISKLTDLAHQFSKTV